MAPIAFRLFKRNADASFFFRQSEGRCSYAGSGTMETVTELTPMLMLNLANPSRPGAIGSPVAKPSILHKLHASSCCLFLRTQLTYS